MSPKAEGEAPNQLSDNAKNMIQSIRGGAAASPEGAAPQPDGAAAPQPSNTAPEAPPTGENYADMPMLEVGSRAVSNLIPSGKKALTGIYDAFANYEDTASGLNQLAKGLVSKGKGTLGFERNPEAEGVVDSIVKMYGDRYGTAEGFKKTLAEDPFAIGMDVASVVPVIGPASKAAGVGAVGNTVSKVAALGDPLALAAKATSLAANTVAKPVASLARYGQGMASGVPQDMLKLAQQAGKSGTPAQREAFTTFAMQQGDNRDMAKAVVDAMEERKAAVSNEYTAGKASLKTDELMMDDIKQSLMDARAGVDPYGTGLNPEKMSVIDEMEQQIANVEAAADPAARSAVGLDLLKRSLRDILSRNRMSTDGGLAAIPRSVRDTIAKADSGYADLMDQWQNWLSEAQDLKATLGTGDRTSETARIAKLLSTAKSSDKMSLLMDLSRNTQAGHTLPYMVAGATVSKLMPPYLQGAGLGGLGILATGGAKGALAAAAGSPRIAGLSNYAVGRAQSAVPRLRLPPAAVTNTLAQSEEYRPERKSGGRVSSHEMAADQLVRAAERAKKGLSAQTEPLLNQSDETVVKALEVANRSI
jgi:hypothetical protein